MIWQKNFYKNTCITLFSIFVFAYCLGLSSLRFIKGIRTYFVLPAGIFSNVFWDAFLFAYIAAGIEGIWLLVSSIPTLQRGRKKAVMVYLWTDAISITAGLLLWPPYAVYSLIKFLQIKKLGEKDGDGREGLFKEVRDRRKSEMAPYRKVRNHIKRAVPLILATALTAAVIANSFFSLPPLYTVLPLLAVALTVPHFINKRENQLARMVHSLYADQCDPELYGALYSEWESSCRSPTSLYNCVLAQSVALCDLNRAAEAKNLLLSVDTGYFPYEKFKRSYDFVLFRCFFQLGEQNNCRKIDRLFEQAAQEKAQPSVHQLQRSAGSQPLILLLWRPIIKKAGDYSKAFFVLHPAATRFLYAIVTISPALIWRKIRFPPQK